jgi:hypothetical protein
MTAVIIPFRDRGTDPLRKANLERVLQHWDKFDATVLVTCDGLTGDGQFNRSKAYNRGANTLWSDVLVFTESDMLIDFQQIRDAIYHARSHPGLVVPFTEYRYLSPEDSERVRAHTVNPQDCTPEWVVDHKRGGNGAINILSRETLNLVGQWDEHFEGNGWDDRAMRRAFDICAGPTRWITGPAYHLHHLPGWKGDHLTDADKTATQRNRQRYRQYKLARTPQRIRELTTS